jgi:hypothetical protein
MVESKSNQKKETVLNWILQKVENLFWWAFKSYTQRLLRKENPLKNPPSPAPTTRKEVTNNVTKR